jgi:DNA repair exonuclease SbcCD ATPase subunit
MSNETETETEIQFADLEYPDRIEKLYHISDIHIRLQKRHDEYKKVFTNLYQQLKDEVKTGLGGDNKKGLIVITGDILHSKTELSPECVSLTADFFQKLAKIMPLVLIAGNHDANLNNNNRMDSLTPIVEKVISKSQCYYLRESGFYRFNNLIFGLTSVFDYNFTKADHISDLNLEGIDYKVGLFHGRVDGAITDTGTIMEGERGINKKSFEGYDYSLLGDIHKHQFMIPGKMAYAGSLIQQNHGETQRNHGFLVWDLKNGKVEHREVKNDFGYITLKIKNGKLIKQKDVTIPSKCYLRLEIDDKTTREEQKKILEEFKEKRTIVELIQTNLRTLDNSPKVNKNPKKNGVGDGGEGSQEGFDENDENTGEGGEDGEDGEDGDGDEGDGTKSDEKLLRSLSFNVSNPQFQNDEIEKYLLSKKVSTDMIDKVKKMNLENNQQILIAETILGSTWKIKQLEFSNLFCYGADNKISFEKAKGVVGLVAPNHSGKSSILDVILYTLFDKTSRKGSGKEIIRLGEKSFKSKLEIEMNDKLFVISKKGTKKTGDVMSVSLEFSYYAKSSETGKMVSTKLTGKTPVETRRVVESYFGTFDDMVMTTVSLQNNNTQFADATSAEKRKEFEKLLRIDIFERLKELSLETSRDKKAILKHMGNEVTEDVLKGLLDDHLTLEQKLRIMEEELEKEKELLAAFRQKESGLMIRLSSAMNQVPEQYRELAKRVGLEGYRDKLVSEIENLKDEFDLEAAAEIFSNANLSEWKEKEAERKQKLRVVEEKLDRLSRDLYPVKTLVEPPNEKMEVMVDQSNAAQEDLFKIKGQIKKLKECDWEEKKLVNDVCNLVVEKQLEKYPRNGKLKLSKFYDDLEETIHGVLDSRYQPGSKDEIEKLVLESHKIQSHIDLLGKKMQDLSNYNKNLERKLNNEKIQEQIDILKKKKNKLENSEFDVSSFIDYQKLQKKETELCELNLAFDNIAIYSQTHSELNFVMQNLIDTEERLQELEETRGSIRGSICVVETEMKTVRDKKKKIEDMILELDVLTTYQECIKAVPFIIIDKVVPQLENTINRMLTSLVNFTLNFKITDKELNVYITRPHGQIPLSNSSGFEKFVGSLFLRIGLIKISNLPKANFLAIDEGWSNFDYENMNNVSMIMDYLRTEFDFVILVSHLQAMREQTDYQININVEKKTGGEFGLSSVCYPHS